MPVVGEMREIALEKGAEIVIVVEPGVVYRGMAYPFDKSLRLASVDLSLWKDADSEYSVNATLGDWERGERVRAGRCSYSIPEIQLWIFWM